MTTNANQSVEAQDTFDAKRTASALDALQPNAQQLKRTRFLKLFPHIKAAKERGVPVKQILTMLTSNGIKLSAATFAKLYEDALREPSAAPAAD